MRKILILTLIVICVNLSTPMKVEACSGLLCTLWDGDMGVTDRAKIDAEAKVKMAEATGKQQAEIARINAQRDATLKQGDLDIERQRVAGLITTEQAETARAQFQAQTDAWAEVQTKLIGEKYETQRDALLDQTNLGLESIRETGKTARLNLGLWAALAALVLLLIVGAGVAIMHFRTRPPAVYLTGAEYQKLPAYDRRQIIDARTYYPAKVEDHDY